MLAKAFPSTAAPRFEPPSAVAVQPPQIVRVPPAKSAQPAKPAESAYKRPVPTESTAVTKQVSSKPTQPAKTAAQPSQKPRVTATKEPSLSAPAYSLLSPKLLARVPDLPQPELRPTQVSPLASPPKKVEGAGRAASTQPEDAKKYAKPADSTPLSKPPFRTSSAKNSGLALVLQDKPIPVDVPPIVRNGNALVPFRQVFERAGGIVVWIPSKKAVHGQAPGKNVTLTIGSKRANVKRTGGFDGTRCVHTKRKDYGAGPIPESLAGNAGCVRPQNQNCTPVFAPTENGCEINRRSLLKADKYKEVCRPN
jgi:hypothetical protein